MEFHLEPSAAKILSIKDFPFFTLTRDTWDDYGKKTLFTLWVYKSTSLRTSLGKIKIISNDESHYDSNGYVLIPDPFTTLPEAYCSLGQDLEFYNRVANNLNNESAQLLDSLNDLATNPGLVDDFDHLDVYTSSLIRFSEAEKSLKRGLNTLQKTSFDEEFDFNFSCRIGSADTEHDANFKFIKNTELPNRVIAIVGGNGTGKTQYLSKLSLALSGEEAHGTFSPSRPLFNKIIAVSYSAFDKFKRPRTKKTFSYKYCGLKDDSGFMTPKKLESIYKQACDRIVKSSRVSHWSAVLSIIIDPPILNNIYEDLFVKELYSKVAHNSEGTLSSGQSILMYVITEIIANIRDDSLILFDEPEMHLHPNAISKLVIMLNHLLKNFNSYAILATHSPIILQEIPSTNVRVFERTGNTPNVRNLDIETFGENLTTITKSVFETVNTEQNYKKVLKLLSAKHSFENIQAMFSGRLSLNAEIYLKGCYTE
ncbi:MULTISPECIES: ATP-dependent endonuclease [Pseudomonas]|uniref:ATPase n=1 Tax=Pseudomonas umsongensis TaxID=198618 RepID=A0ACC5MI57_9PSED|nr:MULTISPECIES: AAA family ATPase [Pseudomonas]MBB2888357.1 putative ATPase [Pseudomonas umsongensis]NMN75913.1 putative ATP-dependent endonuclease of the OLD family [Pseudomonas sp. KD5]